VQVQQAARRGLGVEGRGPRCRHYRRLAGVEGLREGLPGGGFSREGLRREQIQQLPVARGRRRQAGEQGLLGSSIGELVGQVVGVHGGSCARCRENNWRDREPLYQAPGRRQANRDAVDLIDLIRSGKVARGVCNYQKNSELDVRPKKRCSR